MIPEIPTENSPAADRRVWNDRIAWCAISVGKTIADRKLQPAEVPCVLGVLVRALADQTSLSVDTILAMIQSAATQDEMPENAPAPLISNKPAPQPL